MPKRAFQVELDDAEAADLEQLAASLKVTVSQFMYNAVTDAIRAKQRERDRWASLSNDDPAADALDD